MSVHDNKIAGSKYGSYYFCSPGSLSNTRLELDFDVSLNLNAESKLRAYIYTKKDTQPVSESILDLKYSSTRWERALRGTDDIVIVVIVWDKKSHTTGRLIDQMIE